MQGKNWLDIEKHMHVFLKSSPGTGTSSLTSSSTKGFPAVWWQRQASWMHCFNIVFPRFWQSKAEMCSMFLFYEGCTRVFCSGATNIIPRNTSTWPDRMWATEGLCLTHLSGLPQFLLPQTASYMCTNLNALYWTRLCCAVLAGVTTSLCCVRPLLWLQCFWTLPSPELLSARLISSDLWGGRGWGEARLYSYPGWITTACGYQDSVTKPPPLPVQTQFRGCEKKGTVNLSYLFADWNEH